MVVIIEGSAKSVMRVYGLFRDEEAAEEFVDSIPRHRREASYEVMELTEVELTDTEVLEQLLERFELATKALADWDPQQADQLGYTKDKLDRLRSWVEEQIEALY